MKTVRSLSAMALVLWSAASLGGTLTFDFGDGFNDGTPATPVGGNTGTTLGQQRQNLFQAAGQIWADLIDSPVPIVVNARFSSLQCDAGGAVLGSAGAAGNSTNPALMGNVVFYPRALQDAILGSDQNPGEPDINANFNINVDDGNCPGFTGFYYGLDNNAPNNQPALFATVLHEIAHGLGFSAVIAEDGGYQAFGNPPQEFVGIFDLLIFDVDDNAYLTDLPQAARAASILDDPNLVWDGAEVTANFSTFTNSGSNAGSLRLYAPGTYEGGSSVSHFTTAASPDLLMEPVQGNLAVGQTDVTPYLFRDLGYAVTIGPPTLIFASSFEAGE